MRCVFGKDALVSRWVALNIPQMRANPDFGPCAAIGVVDEMETPVGGAVFHNYQPHLGTIEVSCAAISSRWLTKSVISLIFSYPFAQLGCHRVSAITPSGERTSARQLLKGLGFTCEGIARSGFGAGKDAEIWSLLSDEWARSRFNLGRDLVGQEFPKSPDARRSRRARKRSRAGKQRHGAVSANAEHGELVRA